MSLDLRGIERTYPGNLAARALPDTPRAPGFTVQVYNFYTQYSWLVFVSLLASLWVS